MGLPNQDKTLEKVKAFVFRLLKIRLRSEKEIIDKLIKKFPSNDIEKTLNYFKDLNLIDDRQFAKEWISSRLNKSYGFKRINYELRQKGINNEMIKEEWDKTIEEYDLSKIVQTLAEKRLRLYQHLEKPKAKRRLLEYLMRRGFTHPTVYQVINRLFKNQNDRE